MTISGRQIHGARALLGLHCSRSTAKVGTVATVTIIRAEEVDDEPRISSVKADVIRQALEQAGIEIGPQGSGLGKVGL